MNPLDKIPVELKSGKEMLRSGNEDLPWSLMDFWQWSVSDIVSNATRGRFAEFIIATAIGSDLKTVRDEWQAFDLETKDNIKIEVKSAAYLQSWFQKKLSSISFSIKPSRHWDNTTNIQAKTSKRHGDIYVFCLLKHMDKATIDPLNLDQWEFYVLATRQIDNYKRSQHSITLKSLQKLTSAVSYNLLNKEIIEKNKLNS